MSEPVLVVEGLTTSFRTDEGWKKIVRDISFDVAAGETLAIVGESGSGKSVTAMSIMRLLDPANSRIDGVVKLDGRELLRLREPEMRQVRGRDISMIFQEPMTSLNPVFTVGRQIGEVLTRHKGLSRKEARQTALGLMDRVRIPNAKTRIDEYPHQFSGGMRQRIMIAMALAARPRLLIADEPTTALDVTIQGQILELIKELQREEQMAILFITHDMGVVAEIADRTLVMLRGDRVEMRATTDIFASGSHPYTRALLAAVPRIGSMSGKRSPLRFPAIDPQTGGAKEMPPVQTAVDRTAQPILSVKNLVARFDAGADFLGRPTGSVHAVQDVSFDLYAGETLSLVGESGCGKSTTGRAILRLVEPLSGDITLDGMDVRSLKHADMLRLRRSGQMIFQDPFSSLNPRMTVGQTVAEPILKHKIETSKGARQMAADLLQQVGLDPSMLDRYPHEFSGGQRQRIAIARVLGLKPKVIVADESVSALDVSIKAQVCNLLMDLQDRYGIAFLFISHDMAVVERMSHRVAVMYLGEVVEIGEREAVFGNPQHPYTKTLLASVPVPDPTKRVQRRNLAIDELKSPVRPKGYQPPQRTWRTVAAGHLVLND